MDQQKPTLNIPRGEVYTIKLESNKPFKEGVSEGQYGKKEWFGYNATHKVETQGSTQEKEYTYFTSKAVHELIQISQIGNNTYFTLELRLDKTKDGNSISVWYLNGINKYKYQDSGQEVQVASTTVETPHFEETTTAPPSINPEPQPEPSNSNKDKIVQDYITQVEINLNNAQELLKKLKDEVVVPF